MTQSMDLDTSRVIVACGGREYGDRLAVRAALVEVVPTLLIHGGATGADSLAGQEAHAIGIPVIVCPANWTYYGKSAGPRRNSFQADVAMMLIEARWASRPEEMPILLAFPGGVGTAGMISIARQRGWKVIEYA